MSNAVQQPRATTPSRRAQHGSMHARTCQCVRKFPSMPVPSSPRTIILEFGSLEQLSFFVVDAHGLIEASQCEFVIEVPHATCDFLGVLAGDQLRLLGVAVVEKQVTLGRADGELGSDA